MKSRPRKLLLLAGVMLVFSGIIAWRFYYGPKQAVERYKRELIAHGEKLSVDEMIPPIVFRENNSVDDFLKAAFLLSRRGTLLETNPPVMMRTIAPGRAMTGWQLPSLVNFDPKQPVTNDWAELSAAVEENKEALTLLHNLIERPTVQMRLNYRDGFSTLLPHLSQMKMVVNRLGAAAQLELRNGNPAGAARHTRTMLAMAHAWRDERFIISQLVRIADANIAFAATWSLLQSPELTEEQLATVQRDWEGLSFALPMENAIAMERAINQMTMERMRNSTGEFKKNTAGLFASRVGNSAVPAEGWMEQAGELAVRGFDAAKNKAKESAWRVSWSLTDEIKSLKGIQVALDAIRAARSNGCFHAAIQEQKIRLDQLGITGKTNDVFDPSGLEPDLRTLFSDSVAATSSMSGRVLNVEASRSFVIAAIALKRFRIANGRWPEELAALVPKFLPTTPRDPVDDKPLRYRRDGTDSFILYSVGSDGVDDGGDLMKANGEFGGWQQARDWVWPQPASAAEIEKYFARNGQPWKKGE